MKLLRYGKDGGPKSTVWGFWFIEIKPLFSIVLLCFEKGSREVFHSHAFNALTWWIRGDVEEYLIDGTVRVWAPSFKPKYTPRSCFHKVYAIRRTWAISIRGPWQDKWFERNPITNTTVTLTHGRKVVA